VRVLLNLLLFFLHQSTGNSICINCSTIFTTYCMDSPDFDCARCTFLVMLLHSFSHIVNIRCYSSSIARSPQHGYGCSTSLYSTALRDYQFNHALLPTLLICKICFQAYNYIWLLLPQCHAIPVFYPLRRFCFDISTSPFVKLSS